MSPEIVIHTYRKVGYAALPHRLNEPVPCVDMTPGEMDAYNKHESECKDKVAGVFGQFCKCPSLLVLGGSLVQLFFLSPLRLVP